MKVNKGLFRLRRRYGLEHWEKFKNFELMPFRKKIKKGNGHIITRLPRID